MFVEALTFPSAGADPVALVGKRYCHGDTACVGAPDGAGAVRPLAGRALAVCTHCYPPEGCTMDHPVVHMLSCAAFAAGFDVLRFNFRSAGGSAGEFDHGRGEQDDLRGALGCARQLGYDGPIALLGFSFGSAVNLAALPTLSGVTRLVALGFPTQVPAEARLSHTEPAPAPLAIPSLWICGQQDPYSALDGVRADVPFATPPVLREVPAADHFFGDRRTRQRVGTLVTDFLAGRPVGAVPPPEVVG